MQIVKLYRIKRDDGGITITPNKPSEYESETFRIVADEGMELVKGDIRTSCIDTESLEGWTEEPAEEAVSQMRL